MKRVGTPSDHSTWKRDLQEVIQGNEVIRADPNPVVHWVYVERMFCLTRWCSVLPWTVWSSHQHEDLTTSSHLTLSSQEPRDEYTFLLLRLPSHGNQLQCWERWRPHTTSVTCCHGQFYFSTYQHLQSSIRFSNICFLFFQLHPSAPRLQQRCNPSGHTFCSLCCPGLLITVLSRPHSPLKMLWCIEIMTFQGYFLYDLFESKRNGESRWMSNGDLISASLLFEWLQEQAKSRNQELHCELPCE